MKVIYVAGPYRGDVEANIARAKMAAIALWKRGWAVFCPHTNAAHFDHAGVEDAAVLAGDLELLRRCDAIFLLNGWEHSEGSRRESNLATKYLIQHYYEPRGYPRPEDMK